MIAVDGSAVNLSHVTQVLAEKRASHVDDTWYVLVRPAGICLATDLESREAAVAWIEQRFRSFDQHVSDATALIATSS
jgi:hypothetical protein